MKIYERHQASCPARAAEISRCDKQYGANAKYDGRTAAAYRRCAPSRVKLMVMRASLRMRGIVPHIAADKLAETSPAPMRLLSSPIRSHANRRLSKTDETSIDPGR